MKRCRVCDAPLPPPVYEAPPPALTSIMTMMDVPTTVRLCIACSHAQSSDIPDVDTFYGSSYRISLDSEDHDQIVGLSTAGAPIYRTSLQAEIGLQLLDLPEGAAVLDYGAAKADTLRKMHHVRPDIQPHVFDVSNDYRQSWLGWVPKSNQAVSSVPSAWAAKFQAIISHFVIEHIENPIAQLDKFNDLLSIGGKLLLSMPNFAANPGDMIVVDHLNHFSTISLRRALARTGFAVDIIDTTTFPGAFFVAATRTGAVVPFEYDEDERADAIENARRICSFWTTAASNLDETARRFKGRRAAIYGSGFYGSWIYSRVAADINVLAFLDQNPKLQGSLRYGLPVDDPSRLPPDAELLLVGLNPLKARTIIENQPYLKRPGLDLIWID